MMRLLPKSLGGQLAALLIAGLLTAHVASLLIFASERRSAVDAAVRFEVVERVAALVEIIDEAPPDTIDRLAAALSTRRSRIAVQPESSLPPAAMNSEERAFSEALAELSLGERQPRVRLTKFDRSGSERDNRRRRMLRQVEISVPLRDGRWLNADAFYGQPRSAWSWPWIASLGASTLITLAIVALMIGRITRPLRGLAQAAERVGRGESVAPLPATGPSEIRKTVEAFNAMGERLSRFVRDRTRMVAAISHDLRTPITALRLRTEFVEDETLKGEMIRSLDEMQAMADATLAFARGEEGAEETRSADLAAMIEGIVDDQKALGHAASYEGPERLPWRCRPVSLKRAIANLVENAVRYGGMADVGLAHAGGGVQITIEDNGPGIPADKLQDVFEPFVRLEPSRSRDTGGVGLGLSIARSIIHSHGGEVTLANKADRGLRVVVSLP